MPSSDSPVGFKVWGSDNIVYGPVELPTLVNWIQEQRVLATNWIYCEKEQTWRKARELPELRLFFSEASGETVVLDSPPKEVLPKDLNFGSLRRIKVFAPFTNDQLVRFLEFMEVQPVRQWTQIVKQGEPGDAMYMVLEGEVRVRMMVAGRETILVTLQAGDFFGEIALFDHGTRSADVIANQDSLLVKLSAGAFQRLSSQAPDLASPFLLGIGQTLTSRIRADNKRLRDHLTFARASGF